MPDRRNEAATRQLALALGVTVAVTMSIALVAWGIGGAAAHAVADHIKANAALGYTLCAVALALQAARVRPWVSDVLALGAAVIGAATLYQYTSHVDLGIDQLLQREHSVLAEASRFPNRMAPTTALTLCLLAAAQLIVRFNRGTAKLAQVLSGAAMLIGFTALVGYLYEASELYQPMPMIRMSSLSAAASVVLGVGLMAVRTDVGLSALAASRGAGGYMLRRTLPVAAVLPVLVGLLRLEAHDFGLVDLETGTALMVVALVCASFLLATMLATSVGAIDQKRHEGERTLSATAHLTASLSRASTLAEVTRVVVNQGPEALGAVAAALALPTADGEGLELTATAGHDALATDPYACVPLDSPTPLAQAYRDAAPVLIGSRAEFRERFPQVPEQDLKFESWVALPLFGPDRKLGSLGLSFSSPQRFSAAMLEQLNTLAWHSAQAIDRAMLLDSEQRLRASAERTAHELDALRAAAVSANRTKDEFLAMLGHELRNPLAPIAIALDMLDRRNEKALLRERKIIARQVKHLMRMVDDLLDVSRIARGKIRLEHKRVELKTIVDKAVEIAAPLFEQKRHVLNLDVPEAGLPLWGDEHRLTQVVSNLLTNAARYTDDNGHVWVKAERTDGRVVLTVRDDGGGIAPEQLPRLFEAFVQAPTEQRVEAGGLGLGLALVKRFTEAHGGRVLAESDGLGRGATFTVDLPMATETQRNDVVASLIHPTAAVDARRVLVVDDNADAAELLAEGLRDAGHRVEVAHDGSKAIDLAAQLEPEIAFLDLGLPAMDGYELAGRLREKHHKVVLVAVTGYGQPSDRARTQAAGFQHHLVKPVELETTLDITRHVAKN